MAEEIFTETGRLVKMEVDYSSTVDDKLPECEKMAKVSTNSPWRQFIDHSLINQEGKLHEALEILLGLEKAARTGADTHSTSRILVAIAKLCFEAKDFKALNENILILTKRRSQIKQSVTKMIQECCCYVDQIQDKATKLALIDTLRQVTAGKVSLVDSWLFDSTTLWWEQIYVEVERARLTHTLAKIKEADGDLDCAASIMQELQVETFGSMDKKEKVEFILEQMRLCLAKDDFIRTQIISKKIHVKFFDDAAFSDLRLKYYQLMIQLDQNDKSYLKICKHFRAIYETKSVQENPVEKLKILRNVILYLILSPFDNEQHDLIQRVLADKSMDDLPQYKTLLKMFNTCELIRWSFIIATYEAVLRRGTPESPATCAFSHDVEGEKRWNDLKNRVVEHNIRIMAKYYSRITLNRMAQLLDLTPLEAEEVLSGLVVKKTVWAKVDRLDSIVNFTCYKDPNEVLNDWSHDLNSLMNSIARINHLINKEEMVHFSMNAPLPAPKSAAGVSNGAAEAEPVATS